MFNTPNGGLLQTDIVQMQSALSKIKGDIYNIILNIDKLSQNKVELLKNLQEIDKTCTNTLFVIKFEKDEIEQAKENAEKS
jgi:hypothetical protein